MQTHSSHQSANGWVSMSKSEHFEAKAQDADRLARDIPALRNVYEELASVWRRMARQVAELRG
jgi:hypothetical protein